MSWGLRVVSGAALSAIDSVVTKCLGCVAEHDAFDFFECVELLGLSFNAVFGNDNDKAPGGRIGLVNFNAAHGLEGAFNIKEVFGSAGDDDTR